MEINDLVSQIRLSSREMIRHLGLINNRFESIGSISQCHTIVELDFRGTMNLKQLSEILILEKSTTSRLVMQLIDRGICKIQSDKDDRRNKIISLTKKGKTLVNKIHREATEQVQQALLNVTDEEKNIIAKGIMTYAQALKAISEKK